MFVHTHPYEPFLFPEATKLIVGTLPPPRFTTGELREGDVDFCYGSRDGQLWPILDRIFDLGLKFETTPAAVEQRKAFLRGRGIGICDIVASAKRLKVDASDQGLQDLQLRDIIGTLNAYPMLRQILFMGGRSKNGPEYLFRRQLKTHGIVLRETSSHIPRIHSFRLPFDNRLVETVTLIAPSGAANRAVGSMKAFKRMKETDPDFNVVDFRVQQYRPYF